MTLPLGERIRSWRASQGMRQKDLAELVGIDAGYLSKIERGTHTPSVPVLMKLADTIRASVAELTDDRLNVSEPRTQYEAAPVSRPAPPGLRAAGITCRPGDSINFRPTSTPDDHDIILASLDGVEVIGVVAPHPSTAEDMLWLPDGTSRPLEDVTVVGVAIAVSRPIKRV